MMNEKNQDLKSEENLKESSKVEGNENYSANDETVEDIKIDWEKETLYLRAEVQNLHKRFTKEKADLIRYSNENLFRNILPIVDNFELAIKAIKDAQPNLDDVVKNNSVYKNMKTGVEMTLTHFQQTLEQMGVKSLTVENQEFNPNEHEAIGDDPESDLPDNHVSQIVQKGYKIYDRILRPAKVLVSKSNNKKNSKDDSKKDSSKLN